MLEDSGIFFSTGKVEYGGKTMEFAKIDNQFPKVFGIAIGELITSQEPSEIHYIHKESGDNGTYQLVRKMYGSCDVSHLFFANCLDILRIRHEAGLTEETF
jgi:hypothetical protein